MSARRRMTLAIAALACAPMAAAQQGGEVNDKPFAEHHLVIQLSDAGRDKQGLVLSVANNLLKVYDPDRIAIEVVAFGPGIDLLREGGPERERVDSLVAQGVRFDVCGNTLDTIERETGARPQTNPRAIMVQAGAARILELTEHGYTLIRP